MYNSPLRNLRDTIHNDEFLTHLPFYMLIIGTLVAGPFELHNISQRQEERNMARQHQLEALAQNSYHPTSTK